MPYFEYSVLPVPNKTANKALQDYVSKNTKGLINNPFNLPVDTLLALVNTFYLKEVWDIEDDLVFTKEKYNFTNYDKNIIEPFALSTIAKSFDAIYADYHSPESTDNLDYISPDGSKAIEITTVIPNNVIGGFVYDKALSKGKNPSPNKIKKAKVDASGNLLSFYGGSMSEIRRGIIERIEEKNDKVIKRKIIVFLNEYKYY